MSALHMQATITSENHQEAWARKEGSVKICIKVVHVVMHAVSGKVLSETLRL